MLFLLLLLNLEIEFIDLKLQVFSELVSLGFLSSKSLLQLIQLFKGLLSLLLRLTDLQLQLSVQIAQIVLAHKLILDYTNELRLVLNLLALLNSLLFHSF